MTDSINGWTPPVIYDMSTDGKRIATQVDIDNLESVRRAYGQMRRLVKEMETVHQALTRSWLSNPLETSPRVVGHGCDL